MSTARKPLKIPATTEIATVTSAGLVTLPRKVRVRLALKAGDKLAFTILGDGRTVLRGKARRLASLAGILTRPGQPSISRVDLLSKPEAGDVGFQPPKAAHS